MILGDKNLKSQVPPTVTFDEVSNADKRVWKFKAIHLNITKSRIPMTRVISTSESEKDETLVCVYNSTVANLILVGKHKLKVSESNILLRKENRGSIIEASNSTVFVTHCNFTGN